MGWEVGAGANPETFQGRGFEIFLYRSENLGCVWEVFLNKPY